MNKFGFDEYNESMYNEKKSDTLLFKICNRGDIKEIEDIITIVKDGELYLYDLLIPAIEENRLDVVNLLLDYNVDLSWCFNPDKEMDPLYHARSNSVIYEVIKEKYNNAKGVKNDK